MQGRQLVENLTNQIILTDSFESGGLGALHGINGLKEEVLRKSKEKEYSLLKDLRDTVEGLSETSTRASRLRDDFDRGDCIFFVLSSSGASPLIGLHMAHYC